MQTKQQPVPTLMTPEAFRQRLENNLYYHRGQAVQSASVPARFPSAVVGKIQQQNQAMKVHKFEIISTNLSTEQEEKLRAAFSEEE